MHINIANRSAETAIDTEIDILALMAVCAIWLQSIVSIMLKSPCAGANGIVDCIRHNLRL